VEQTAFVFIGWKSLQQSGHLGNSNAKVHRAFSLVKSGFDKLTSDNGDEFSMCFRWDEIASLISTERLHLFAVADRCSLAKSCKARRTEVTTMFFEFRLN
jgi:hypothetical protein